MTIRENIIIYGSGGLGRGVAKLIYEISQESKKWNLLGFVDDYEKETEVNGLKVLGGIEFLEKLEEETNVVLAFGSPKAKKNLFNKLSKKDNINFPNLVHPSVGELAHNKLGDGNIISKGVALSSNISIGDFNLIHYNCSIGHDVSIGNYNSVFPLSALSGYVMLGDCVEIGTSCAIIPNVKFGNCSVAGAGSTIIKNVSEKSKVVGVPAKEI